MDELDKFLDSPPQQVSQDALDAFLDEPDTPPGVIEDTVRGAASGIARGIPYTIDVPAAALASSVEFLGGRPFGEAFRENMGQGINAKLATPIFGKEYQPQTEAGMLAKGAGMAVGSLPLGGTGAMTVPMALRTATAGATGTLGSQVGGGIGEAIGGETGRKIGEIGGGLLGGAAGFKSPELDAKAMRGIGEATVPTAAADLAPLAQRAKDFDIPLSLDQIAPSKVRSHVQNLSQSVPFSGVDKFQKTQSEAWNKAVAKTLGEDMTDLAPESVQKFLTKSEEGFNGILKDKNIKVADESLGEIDSIAKNASEILTGDLAEVVAKNVDKLKSDIQNGVIRGEKLASFRSKLIKALPRAQGGAKEYLGDLIEEVDNLSQTAMSAEEAQALAQLRREWRNYRTVEPLLEKSTTGEINPTSLMQRVASSPYIKASRTSTGQDDLVDLARIGKQFLKIPGGSDTANKSMLLNFGTAVGSPGAYAVAPTTTATAGAGLLVNRGFQKYINQSQKLVEKSLKKAVQAPNPKERIKIELRDPRTISRKP